MNLKGAHAYLLFVLFFEMTSNKQKINVNARLNIGDKVMTNDIMQYIKTA